VFKEYTKKEGFLMKKAQELVKQKNNSLANLDTRKEKVKFNKKDSILNPHIEQNFYPPGSLLVEMTFMDGEIKGKSILVEAKLKSDLSPIQTLEFMFDNQEHVTNHLDPEQ